VRDSEYEIRWQGYCKLKSELILAMWIAFRRAHRSPHSYRTSVYLSCLASNLPLLFTTSAKHLYTIDIHHLYISRYLVRSHAPNRTDDRTPEWLIQHNDPRAE
jgi:hypothetical protein